MIDIVAQKKSWGPSLVGTLQGKSFKRPPCWLMRQAGRYLPEYRKIRAKHCDFTSFLFSVDDVVEVTLQPLKRFDLDAAIIFSDILVVPLMLGVKVAVLESLGPRLSPLTHPDEIGSLNDAYNPTICEPVYQALNQVRSALDPQKTLIGFAGGPWTVATYMIEGQTSKAFTKAKNFGYRWPDAFQNLLELLSDVTANHLIQQIKAGAQVVKVFDSWAGSVPHDHFEDWVIKPHQLIIQKIKNQYPDVPIIAFPKGISEEGYLQYINEIGVEGIAFDPQLNPTWVAENIQTKKVVQGGMDPSLLMVGGNPLIKGTITYLEALAKGPYIFNLGHGVVPETPPENVELMLKTIDEYAR